MLDEYEARTSVGEIGDAQRGLELLGAYTAVDERVHMCYAFELLGTDRITPKRLKDVFDRFDASAADGWACWAFSNHDVMRHATRWRLGDAALRLHTTMQMCLRGSVCLYQGGRNWVGPKAEVAYENVKDPYGAQFWPEFKGRDGCARPWPGMGRPKTLALDRKDLATGQPAACRAKRRRPGNRCGRDLAPLSPGNRLQTRPRGLVDGTQKELTIAGDAVHFMRENAREEIFCAFNLSDNDTTVTMPAGHMAKHFKKPGRGRYWRKWKHTP